MASGPSEEVHRGRGVGERSRRRVAGPFPLSLFPPSQHFLLLSLPTLCLCQHSRRGAVEKKDKLISFFDLQARVRSPGLDTYFLQTFMLGTHTPPSLCSCLCSSSLPMIGWGEGESACFCFIIALAKGHPLFFLSFRLCYAPAYGLYISIVILEGSGVFSEALRSVGHATW